MPKKSFSYQFKKKYFPDQPVDPNSMVNRPNSSSSAKTRSRNGLSRGTMQQANPGLAGRSSFGSSKKTLKRS